LVSNIDSLLCPSAPNESPAKPNGYGGAKAAKRDACHISNGALVTARICMSRCLLTGRLRQILAPLSPVEKCGTHATFVNLFVWSQKQIRHRKPAAEQKRVPPRRLQIVRLKRKRVHHSRISLESF
jgi:hypothetical protein